ncbi:MAG: NTP transferase domain-containing protein, partial [Vicinamibacterales bacterium]
KCHLVRTPETVLIIPAAGAGTRLSSPTPKVLSPVNGRAMIDHLFDRYRETVRRFVLVVHPSFEADVKRHVEQHAPSLDVQYATQPEPTGMLDAILLATQAAARQKPVSRVWITWCDQVGVHPETIATLDRMSQEHSGTPAILPTSQQASPYIHLDRDGEGRIAAIRQRREGDEMPQAGESDMGLFSLSPDAYFNLLPQFGREAASATATRERNFLPFLLWLVQRGHSVVTFASTNELEAIGINTPDDRRRLEAYLRDLENR